MKRLNKEELNNLQDGFGPEEGAEFLTGKEIKEKYPELWEEIFKIEGKEEDLLTKNYDLQTKGIPREFTHIYTDPCLKTIILAKYGGKKSHTLGLDNLFEEKHVCLRLEKRRLHYKDALDCKIGDLIE